MKKFILTVLATMLGMLLAGFILLPRMTPVDADVAFLEKNRVVREILEPATFTLEQKIYAVTGDKKEYLCETFRGTAFTIKKPGYFLTNNHAVTIGTGTELECYSVIAKEKKVHEYEVDIIDYKSVFTLTNDHGYSFPVTSEYSFPENDLAVLKVSEKETEILKNWCYVPFRTEAIDVAGGKVIPDSDKVSPAILRDEPIATMGNPLGFSFTITRGKAGNNTFVEKGKKYTHAVIPLNGGNSGGAVISLLDLKIVGVATVSMKDGNESSSQSGIISFIDVKNALKTTGLE